MKANNFEEKIEQLEKIVNELESGEMNLDESMASFENGMRLANECNKLLEDAEKKIKKLG